jgi:hypothetical protein
MFENILSDTHFQVLQEIGFGLTREVVGSVIMEYLALAKRQQVKHGGEDLWIVGQSLREKHSISQRK